uniref:Alphavirus-like MT domain-containing protein n=1 Tax=Globodera pallida TaxID=36090 RepID=A0A183BVJ6_GLOPA
MSTFASLGFDVDSSINDLLTQFIRKDPNSPLAEAVNKEFARILDSNANAAVRAKTGSVKIGEKLNVEEQIVLANNIPEFNLIFTNRVEKTHSFASAMRKVEYYLLLEKISYKRQKALYADGRDYYAIDVGGDFSFHVRNANVGIHSDCPVMDERDDARYKSRTERLRREYENDLVEKTYASGADEKFEYVGDFLNKLSKSGTCDDVFCNRLAQECEKTARYLLFVHSNYDISLATFGDIMIKKNSVEAYGSFIFSTDILLNERGVIPMLNAVYVVDKESDTIEFTFRGCQSYAYRHKLSTYLSYVTTHVFYDTAMNRRFLLELLENRCGIQFFKVVPISDETPITMVSHNLWFPSLINKSVVTFYEPDYEALGSRSGAPTLKKCNFVVDNKLIDKLKAQATSQTENKFKPVELYCFFQAYCGPASKALAHAVYIEVYREKYDAGKVLQKILRDVDADRAAASTTTWMKFLRWLGTPCCPIGNAAELSRYSARPRSVLRLSCDEYQRNQSRVGTFKLRVKFAYDDIKGFVVPAPDAIPLSFDVSKMVRDNIKRNHGLNAETSQLDDDQSVIEYSEASQHYDPDVLFIGTEGGVSDCRFWQTRADDVVHDLHIDSCEEICALKHIWISVTTHGGYVITIGKLNWWTILKGIGTFINAKTLVMIRVADLNNLQDIVAYLVVVFRPLSSCRGWNDNLIADESMVEKVRNAVIGSVNYNREKIQQTLEECGVSDLSKFNPAWYAEDRKRRKYLAVVEDQGQDAQQPLVAELSKLDLYSNCSSQNETLETSHESAGDGQEWIPDGVDPRRVRVDVETHTVCFGMDSFVNASSSESVNYIFCFCHLSSVEPFELKNDLTEERLTLRHFNKDKSLLVRCPIVREEDKWANWEKEATEWKWGRYWNAISINLSDRDIDMNCPSEPKKAKTLKLNGI